MSNTPFITAQIRRGQAFTHGSDLSGKTDLCWVSSQRYSTVAELTLDDVGDVSAAPNLLEQIDSGVASMIADGAYDVEAVYDAGAERHPRAAVIISTARNNGCQ